MTGAQATDPVLFRREGAVGVLTLNRPERLNAISGRMMSMATRRIEDLSAERTLRALIITGQGRAFCSGADLGGDARLESAGTGLASQMKKGLSPLILAIQDAPFPVVAAVNGPAAGAGAGLALAADILLAGQSMRLLLSFARIGMGLDAGVSYWLPRLVGEKRALALAMLAENIDAEQAVAWGLAWDAAPDALLMDRALELARRLADGAPLAVAAIKGQLRSSRDRSLAEALDAEADVQARLVSTHDVTEGVSAFRERRPPRFVGA